MKKVNYALLIKSIILSFIPFVMGYLFTLILSSLFENFFNSSFTTAFAMASVPNSDILSAEKPINPNNAIPPIIPKGPSAASAAVKAAAPAKPVELIVIIKTRPGTPKPAIFLLIHPF